MQHVFDAIAGGIEFHKAAAFHRKMEEIRLVIGDVLVRAGDLGAGLS